MMMKHIIFGLALSLVSATKYCCVPEQWEGVIGLLEGLDTGAQPSLVKGSVGVAYDYTNLRLAETVDITVNEKPLKQKIIIDNQKDIMYKIIESQKYCMPTKPAPKIQGCVPDTARKSDSFFFGVGNNTLKGQTFEYDVPSMQMTAVFSLSLDNCVPLTEAVYGSSNGVPFLQTMQYYNITGGIRDPSVFNVPSYCNKFDVVVDKEVSKTGIFVLDYLHARLGFFQ